MVVIASKNIKIGIGRTNFELLTSYFLSIFFLNLTPASSFAIDCRKQ